MADDLIERVQMQRQLEGTRALSADTACERDSASYREQLLSDVLARISRPSITAEAVAGWKLVPTAATAKMHHAAWLACDNSMAKGKDWAPFNAKIWAAMLAAAPAHPAPEGAGEDEHQALHLYAGDSALVIRDNGNKTLHGVQLPELLALFEGDTEPGDLVDALRRAADNLERAIAAESSLAAEKQLRDDARETALDEAKRANAAERRVAALEVALTTIAEFDSGDEQILGALRALAFCRNSARAALRPAETGKPPK